MVIDDIRRDKVAARWKSRLDVYTRLCSLSILTFLRLLSHFYLGIRFSGVPSRNPSQRHAQIRGGALGDQKEVLMELYEGWVLMFVRLLCSYVCFFFFFHMNFRISVWYLVSKPFCHISRSPFPPLWGVIRVNNFRIAGGSNGMMIHHD